MAKNFTDMFKHVLCMNTDEVKNTALHLACIYGRIETVRYIIGEVGLSPTITNKEGQTCFHLACKYGQLSIIQYLYSIDGNSLYRDHDGNTPLHIACQYGQLSIVEFISTTNSERVLDSYGRNPLHVACYYGHLEIVKFCVKNLNFDQFYRDHLGLTPLAHACVGNRLDVVCYLETNIAPIVDNTGYTPLHHVCRHGHLKIVQYLTLERKSRLFYRDHDNNIPLHVAACYNQTEVVDYFLKQNLYDSDHRGENGQTPLILAAFYESYETLKLLIDGYSNCDYSIADDSGKTAFWYIYNQGDIDIIKYYLNAFNCKIEGNYMKKALLHTAAEKGQYVAFKLICESMKNNPVMQISERILYETDDYGNTSLHLASKFGHLEVVKYLVENIKLNLNILNLDGQTCFHLACKYGQLSIMQYICSIDGNIFCRDHDGSTPLHIACHYGHLSIFKFISTTNSERVLDNNGRNPLHIACYYGHLEIVKFCVKNLNFDQFYRDHQGLTPLAHACAGNNRLDIVCYLETNSTPTVDNTGYTPLHHACKHGHLKIVQYLTIEKKSHVLYRDHDNNTPLHVAARHNQTEVVHYFFEQNMYDSDLRGENGRTPLHIAAAYNCGKTLKYLLHCSLYFDPWMEDGSGKSSFLYLFLAGINDIVLKIIRSAKYTIVCQTFETRVFLYLAAEPKHHQSFKHLLQHLTALRDIKKEIVLHQNTDDLGNTALHIACKFESFETVQYILDEIRFPSNTYNFDSQTCLHLASEHGHLSIVKYLTMNNKCDPLSGDQYGHMPLHYAVENGHLSVVKYFIEESRVNMEIRDEWSNTLLHLACTKGHTEIVEFLVNNSSKLLVYNIGGNTPLHLACLAGHYEIFRMLFTTTKYDIHVRNNLGKSIADYAQDKPDMAQTIREVYGVEATFIPKIFVIGFSGAGKSTLVSALQKEASFLGRYLTIPKVPPHTVGVTPVRFQSSSYGTVNLYDFAGHEEYHANHQLLFQSSYLPIVLLLVNLLMKEEDIIFCIKYWVNILRNSLASHASIKRGANIVILGSHYDKIHGDKKTKINNLEVKIEKIFSKWEEEDIKYSRGIICLDCRKPSSNGIEALRNLMHSSCLACRAKIAENCSYETSLICQEILVFLNKSVSFKLACTISDICRIARKEGLIPDRVKSDEEMFEICSTLGFYGKIMLLTNSDHQEDSWIILDEKYILSEFHSSMHLLQSKFNKSFSDQVSCGLVSKSQLQKLFPNNLGLILKYLQYSQICVEIEAESFSIIPQSLLTGCYYFFPYLTQENKPNLFILQSAEEMTPFYGWQVVCHDPFTPRFLQVLLVQLTVPVPGAGDEVQPNYKVWKNRIHIRNNDTTESIIEVTNPACQFIFATRCKKGGETNLLIRRSQLIHLILSVLERNCPLITYEEFVYEPQSSYPIDAYANKVSLKTVAGVLLEGRSTLATWDNQYLDLVTLLGHDPLLFLSIRTLKRIFLHPNDIIPQSIACEYQKSLKPFMKKEKFSTYKELHKCVHQYSIFSDRNIWDIAGSKLKPFPLFEINYKFKLDPSLIQYVKNTSPFIFNMKEEESCSIPFSDISDEEYCYGHDLIKLEGTSEHIVVNKHIMFNNVKKNDSGTYELHPRHKGWSGVIQIKLNVEFAPVYTFTEESKSLISVTEGSTKQIKFTVSANPPLTDDIKHELTCLNGGIEVPATRRFTVSYNTIILTDITPEVTGLYQISCKGGNGQIGKEVFELKILCVPKYTLSKTSLEVTEGSNQEITFSVSSDPPLPGDAKHEICLLKEQDVQVPVPGTFIISQNTITMSNVRCEDSGTYQISCKNVDGVIVKEIFQLTVTTQSQSVILPIEQDSKEVQLLKNNWEKMLIGMTFDTIWLAGEMNRIGLLSDYDHLDVTTAKSLLNETDKAVTLMTSLKKKVALDSKHLNTFVDILKTKASMYSDVLVIFEGLDL